MALVLAASATATVGTTSAQAAEQDGKREGCPSGAVCIYPQDAEFNDGRPSHAFFSYGAHNLENQFGTHIILNNQVDGAKAHACTGYDGKGDCNFLPAGSHLVTNLTPINSIVLAPAD